MELTDLEDSGGDDSRFDANSPRRDGCGECAAFREAASGRTSGADRWCSKAFGGGGFRISNGDELTDRNSIFLPGSRPVLGACLWL